MNPWTLDDFRRILIDLETVRNAWVFCREVEPRGLYDVRLELESDPVLGDLNDRKIVHIYSVLDDAGNPQPVTMELRFPEWGLAKRAEWELFLHNNKDAFTQQNGAYFTVDVSSFGATKIYDVQTDPDLTEDERNAYLRAHWRTIFYVVLKSPSSLVVKLLPLTMQHCGSLAALPSGTM